MTVHLVLDLASWLLLIAGGVFVFTGGLGALRMPDFISMVKVDSGTAPILQPGVSDQIFSNPLPPVLILTAIVVGIATLALGLAIVVRISEAYGTIEEGEIREMDRQ